LTLDADLSLDQRLPPLVDVSQELLSTLAITKLGFYERVKVLGLVMHDCTPSLGSWRDR
jgi:hypothetical protein